MVLPGPELPHTERSFAGSVAGSEARHMAELVYSVKEAADALGVSTSVVYTLIHRTDFPSIKLNGRRVISKKKLAEWVEREASKGIPEDTNDPVYREIRPRF